MGFSQEMKDFLGAWTSVSKINAMGTDQDYKEAQTTAAKYKLAHDYDPERVKTADDQARGAVQLQQEQIKNAGSNRALTAAQIQNAASSRARTDALTNSTNTAVKWAAEDRAKSGAVGGLGTDRDGYGVGAPNTARTDFADGGLVEEEDDTPEPAIGGATDFSARSRQQPSPTSLAPQVLTDVNDAVRGGYKHLNTEFGLGSTGIKSASQKQAAKQMQQGVGGLSPQEMAAAHKVVDPEGKLTESQRNLAALGSVYQFYANKNEPQKADRVAGQMLQYFRAASERYAAIAAHAAESGDMNLAVTAALKSYANVPDGRDMQLSLDERTGKVIYHYTDENGHTISKGIATPSELASSAMGLTQGGFDKALMSSSAAREQAGKAVGKKAPKGESEDSGGSDVAKPSDRKIIREEFSGPEGAITKAKEEWQEKNKDKKDANGEPVKPHAETWGDMQDAAEHIYSQNKVTAKEAVKLAQELIIPGSNREATWKVTDKPDGSVNLQMRNGVSIDLDGGQFESLMNRRTASIKASMDAEEEDKKPKSPSRTDQAIEGAKLVGRGVVGALDTSPLGYAKRAVPAAIDALSSSNESAGQQFRSDMRRVGDRLSNRGAIPVDAEDRPL